MMPIIKNSAETLKDVIFLAVCETPIKLIVVIHPLAFINSK